MTMVENPTQSLRKHVRRIHDPRKVNQDDVLHKSQMLKCKISDFYMTRAISGSTVIDNLDRGIVVFVDRSGLSLSVPQFMKNESQIFGDFHGSISSDEFGFCRALCTDGLRTRAMRVRRRTDRSLARSHTPSHSLNNSTSYYMNDKGSSHSFLLLNACYHTTLSLL